MICPINKKVEGLKAPPPIKSPLRDLIKEQLLTYKKYFRENYPELKDGNLTKSINYFYNPVKDLRGRVAGNNIITNNTVVSIFPKGTPDTKPNSNLIFVLDMMKSRFNFPYIIVHEPESNFKGKYLNIDGQKTVVINTAHATDDTPFHEYFHPFVRLMKNENPELFSLIAKEASFLKMEEEEAVTEYLGKVAASTYRNSLFHKFIDFVSRVLSEYFGVPFRYNPSDTVKELVDRLLVTGADVSSENTLSEAFQLLNTIDNTTGVLSKEDRRTDILGKLKSLTKDFTTDDTTDYYTSPTGTFRRLTSFVSSKEKGAFTTVFANFKSWDANHKAALKYKAENLDKSQKITINGTELTFDELVQAYELNEKTPILIGKLTHAYIEYLLTKSREALAKTESYAAALGVPYIDLDKHPNLREIHDNFGEIVRLSGITIGEKQSKFDDNIGSEVTLKSDILKDSEGYNLASTADLITEKFNGDIGLVDFKSGNITSNYSTSIFMPHGAKFGVRDTKLNHAFMELALRAIMIKEANPDAKFSYLRIVKTSKYGHHEMYEGELELFLNVIGNYYKTTNPSVYAQLEEKGLLDVNNYQGTSMSSLKYYSKIQGKSREESIAIINSELDRLHSIPFTGKQPDYIREGIKELTEVRLELEGIKDIKADLTTDKGFMAKISTLSDLDKKSIKGLNKLLIEARDKETKEVGTIFNQWDKLLEDVYAERPNYGSKKQMIGKTAATLSILFGVATLNPFILGMGIAGAYAVRRSIQNPKDAFGFMYVKSTDPDRPGYFLNNTDSHNGVKLTKAERSLRDYYKAKLASLYQDSMSVVVDMKGSMEITKAMAMRMPPTLPDNFIVRPPKTLDEYKAESELLSSFFGVKDYLKHTMAANVVSLLERDAGISQKDSLYYPVKNFYTSGKVVESEMHSFDADLGFKMMVGNLVHKKHFDTLYPVAQGVINIVEDATTPDGRKALPNILEALDRHVTMQVHSKTSEVRFRSTPITMKVGDKLSSILGVPKGEYEVNQDKIARALKTGLGFTTMAFKTVTATKNFAIISFTNGTKILSQFLSKRFGVESNDDDFTKGTALALKEMTNYWKDWMLGKQKQNKLYLLSEHLNWMPDNFAYGKAKNNLLRDISKPTIGGTAYMFHNFTETYGALTHLAAALNSSFVLVNGKKTSLYDAYDVVNGEVVWKGGTRGVNTLGQELTELDANEVKSFKRIYERTQGSYRAEERTAMEYHILGQFVMQFKKYFYTYAKNQFQSELEDPTMGRYVANKDITRPDGLTTFEWESEIMKGRLNTLVGSLILAGKSGKFIRGGKQGKGDKKRLAELLSTAIFMTLLYWLLVGFDDDEDESPRERIYRSLIYDISQGLNVRDYLSTATEPVVLFTRGSQLVKATLDLMTVSGETSKGKSDRRKARRTIEKTVPFLSNKDMMTELLSNAKIKSTESFWDKLFTDSSTKR
jgi:hypothetical protein